MRVLISAADLERRVAELAVQIDADYRRRPDAAAGPSADDRADLGDREGRGRGGRPPAGEPLPLVAVGVLKGAVFFLADLLKRMTVPVEVDFIQAASYGGGGTRRGELRIRKDLDLDVGGRDVLLVEDIVDSGHTVRAVVDLLRARGARSLRLCTLLDKAAAREVEVAIDYRGFAIDDVFVVGYGLDHDERWRNLDHIAVWEPAAAPAQEAAPAAAQAAAPAQVLPAITDNPERSIPAMQFHHTDQAPAAIGPYSQAVSVDGWVYTSGQIGLDPATGELVAGGFEAQARRALENLHQVLAAAGCGFGDVVKTGVFLADLADFPRLNALYAEAMGDHRPARSTVQVAALPRGAMVEMDMVARLPAGKAKA